MTHDTTDLALGYDDGDIDTNCTANPSLNELAQAMLSRRQAMRNGAGAMAMAVFSSSLLTACGDNNNISRGPTDPAPTAGLTTSGTTSSGRVVTLTGTATDNNPVSSVVVTQTGGPAVNLIPAATPNSFTFIAPVVSAATTLNFRLTATDTAGQVAVADASVTVNPPALGFNAIPKNLNDVVTVPTGYSVTVLSRLGDPIAAGVPAFANDGSDTNFAQRIGDHGDALYYYGLSATGTRDDNSNTRGLIVQNHENITQTYLHINGPTTTGGVRPEAEAIKEIEAHGLSVIEVTRALNGAWSYVQASNFNRRITPNTPTVFNGPVAGASFMQTAFSPDGTRGRGTINNCANGYTPWGTNLTCEENWAGYFRRPRATDDALRTPAQVTSLVRYGVASNTGNYGWSTVTPADPANTLFRKWDARVSGASATADFRNEPYHYGWVVETDPYDPGQAPRKRTALGRMNHEGCWPGNFVVGRRPAFYMGDDAQNEYLYKFVSATPWVAADATATNRLAIGDRYLDQGTLYVAVFNADGTGQWAPLVFGTGPITAANTTYPFANQADVLANARLAADVSGATRMDRPEWTAVNPVTGEVYLTLTNNSSRRPNTVDAANPRAYVDPPSTTVGNRNGHIIRLRETGDNSEATTFTWDIYVFGSGSDLDATNINLSGLTADNDFSSPDGLWFGRATNASGQVTPLLWIQTDDGAFTDQTNNQMLAALPGRVGDGGTRVVNNNAGGLTGSATTRIGAAPGTQLRRFLVGPRQCEITGIDSTPDGRTLFVGIQHPGEDGTFAAPGSNWPATQATGSAPASTRPRSAVVVITKNDGGVVGL